MYDNNGDVFGLTYNGVDYYYIKNAQNDVVAIADSSGVPVVKYYYYAYGAKARTSVNGGVSTPLDSLIAIANANPLRYRSYYFDTETGYYYLNSRYYSPEMCRFINADGILDTNQGLLSHNMFAYCLNNPVNRIDSEGTVGILCLITLGLVAAGIGAISGGLAGLISVYDDVIKPTTTIINAVSIGEDTEQAIGDYTEDVVRSGTESNYTPRPNRNFKGVVANKMNCVNVPKYRQWCEVSYQNMIDMEFISKNDTWEMLQAEGRDKELSRQMIYWDNDMYHLFNYSHAFAQAENAIGG